jgi:hypothetical protein
MAVEITKQTKANASEFEGDAYIPNGYTIDKKIKWGYGSEFGQEENVTVH